jgi:hypothetical protein
MEQIPILTLVVAVATLVVVLLRRPPSLQEKLEKMEKSFSDGLMSTATELSRAQTDSTGRLRQEVSENFLKGMDDISRRIEEKLMEIRTEMTRELSETADRNLKGYDQVAGHLRELGVATGQVVLLSQDIHQLNVLLTQPKARGAFGELTLSQMLSDLFGSHTEMFELQYQMEWGERADAAIFVRPDSGGRGGRDRPEGAREGVCPGRSDPGRIHPGQVYPSSPDARFRVSVRACRVDLLPPAAQPCAS